MRAWGPLLWLIYFAVSSGAFFSSPAFSLNLRSLAETELEAKDEIQPSSKLTSAPRLSMATVEVVGLTSQKSPESPWAASVSWQSFQPLGQFTLPGLSSLELAQIPRGELLELELQTQLRPGLASYFQLAGNRRPLALRGPQGAEIERAYLNSFVLLGGLHLELYRWGNRPLIVGLRSGFGQLSHIVSSSWVEANQSANQWIWSLGPTLAWEFYPGLRSHLSVQRRGEFSTSSEISIEAVSLSLGLQVDLNALP